MRYLFLVLLVIVTIGCDINPVHVPHTLIVINVYQEDVDANDGVIERHWKTLVTLEDGSRDILDGIWGTPGDTLKNMVKKYGDWYPNSKFLKENL